MKNICQSCGMPLGKDPKGGGTEKDGTKSQKFCSLCYNEGRFVNPNMTLEQMKEKVTQVMTEQMHIPGFLARLFALRTKGLERWKKRG